MCAKLEQTVSLRDRFSLQPNILVTGGAGFIGCHLVEALAAYSPAASITVFDKFTYAVVPGALARLSELTGVVVVEGDICDRRAIERVMQGKDLVFHLAAESHVPHSFSAPDLFHRVNCLGTRFVASCAVASGVQRFIHFSTDEVYGPCLFPAKENQALSPTTPYALSKTDGETEIVKQRHAGLDAIILRPSNAVGFGQHSEKLFPRFVDRLKAGQSLGLEGGGSQRRTFISVRDIARAAIHAAIHAPVNATLNIAGADDLSVQEAGLLIGKTLGFQPEFHVLPDRQVNDAAYRLNGDLLADLGFEPKFELTEEIRSLYAGTITEVTRIGYVARAPAIVPSHQDLGMNPTGQVKFHVPHRAGREKSNVETVLATGRLMAGGEFTASVEATLCARTGAPHVHLTHSCTGAMEIAIMALGLGPGDEIIVPTYTFAATATAVARSGAKIVLCDVDPGTMMLTAETVRARLSSRTKAVMVVHYGGASAPMEDLSALARQHGLHLVEDAAQSVGSLSNGKAVGTTGIFGALSFHDTKVIGAGHGGALLCNTDDLALLRRVREILDRGTDFAEKLAGRVDYYQWVGDGSSYRLPELNAAVLDARLAELDCVLAHRRQIANVYRERLCGMYQPWQFLDGNGMEGSNHHVFAMITASSQLATSLIAHAKSEGICLETHYAPLHLSPHAIKTGLSSGSFSGADSVWRRLVRLPLHTGMSLADAARVANTLAHFGKSHTGARRQAIA